MGEVITFLKRIPKEDLGSIFGRGWGKFARRQMFIHTEIARMRQARCPESEIQQTIAEWRIEGSRPQLSLSECKVQGIDVDGDVVIPWTRPRRESCP